MRHESETGPVLHQIHVMINSLRTFKVGTMLAIKNVAQDPSDLEMQEGQKGQKTVDILIAKAGSP